MKKLNQVGDAMVIALAVVVLAAVGGVGYYVVNRSGNKKTETPTKQEAASQVEPAAFVTEFADAFRSNNKSKVDSSVSAALMVGAPSPSFYESCQDDACSVAFGDPASAPYYKSVTPVVTEYTAKDGTKGKTVTYTLTAEQGSGTAFFSLVPKDNSWLLDDFGFTADNSANIDANL